MILVDYPTKDEVLRLAKAGYYDLLDEEDLELLEPQDSEEDAGPRSTRGHNTKISSLDVDQPKILKDKLEGRHHGKWGARPKGPHPPHVVRTSRY